MPWKLPYQNKLFAIFEVKIPRIPRPDRGFKEEGTLAYFFK
jgi:hypothetical protein